MKILILGGTSFIGPFATRGLSSEHAVAVFHRGETEPELPPEVEHIHGDRNDLSLSIDAFRRFGPDVVVDMRAMTESGARMVVETFTSIAPRAVVISSMDVYRAFDVLHGRDSELQPVPIDEDADLRSHLYPYRSDPPRSAGDPSQWLDQYDKILVERVFLNGPLPSTVIRLPAVYGPGDYQHRFFEVAKRLADGRQIMLMDPNRATWRFVHGYVENVAAAIALAAKDERAVGQIYNVAELATPTSTERIDDVSRAVGQPVRAIVVPAERLPERMRETGANLAQDLVVDSSRIRGQLGFQDVVSYAVGLRRTIEWEQIHPPATIDPAAFDYASEDDLLQRSRG